MSPLPPNASANLCAQLEHYIHRMTWPHVQCIWIWLVQVVQIGTVTPSISSHTRLCEVSRTYHLVISWKIGKAKIRPSNRCETIAHCIPNHSTTAQQTAAQHCEVRLQPLGWFPFVPMLIKIFCERRERHCLAQWTSVNLLDTIRPECVSVNAVRVLSHPSPQPAAIKPFALVSLCRVPS